MPENWLLFVDTNILLDFYRLRGSSVSRYLSALEENSDRLILTEQVQMEFLKHRQRVLNEFLREFEKPKTQRVPACIESYQPAISFQKNAKDALANYRKVVSKIERMIENPSRNDRVFKSIGKIFDGEGAYSLKRNTEGKERTRSLARKRFSLGYPPRKKDDTSFGDGLNWEWIVKCACDCKMKSNVFIVSRDGDYGIKRNGSYHVLDWLKKEFGDRVGKRRKIEHSELLADGLKKFDVKVSKKEVEEERDVADQQRIKLRDDRHYGNIRALKYLQNLNLYANSVDTDDRYNRLLSSFRDDYFSRNKK